MHPAILTHPLTFSLAHSTGLQLTVFGLVYVHWILYVNTALVAMGMITYPAVSAYVSNIASPEEQGAVQVFDFVLISTISHVILSPMPPKHAVCPALLRSMFVAC